MGSNGFMTTITPLHHIRVALERNPYNVVIGAGALASLGEQMLEAEVQPGRRVLVVSNPDVATPYGDACLHSLRQAGFSVELLVIDAGEHQKTPATVAAIHDAAYNAKLERSSLMVALGGGVVGDMTGFAAATWLRGIQVVQVPTTLLAMVDASIGGKTGVNHPRGKNLIGAFHQPRLVLIDPSTLNTLPEREFRAGMAEVIKYGLIADANFFNELIDQRHQLRARDPDFLRQVVARCCQIKADVVGRDEREAGIRAILNYGHTFGHAIEKVSGYGEWLHGEAVACGMVMATRLSILRGTIKQDTLDSLLAFLETFDLPCTPPAAMSLDDFLQAMSGDKKVIDGRIRFIVLQSLGDALTVDDVSRDDLAKVIEACR